MYKTSIVYVLCILVCIKAAPPHGASSASESHDQPTQIPIVSQDEAYEPNGTYRFSFATGNGIKREEIAYDKKIAAPKGRSLDKDADSGKDGDDDGDEIHVQIGSFSYVAPDGSLVTVNYTADENGFRPVGSHIPKGPSVSSNDGTSNLGQPRSSDSSAAASEGQPSKSDAASVKLNGPQTEKKSANSIASTNSSIDSETSTNLESSSVPSETEKSKSSPEASPTSSNLDSSESSSEPSSTVSNLGNSDSSSDPSATATNLVNSEASTQAVTDVSEAPTSTTTA